MVNEYFVLSSGSFDKMWFILNSYSSVTLEINSLEVYGTIEIFLLGMEEKEALSLDLEEKVNESSSLASTGNWSVRFSGYYRVPPWFRALSEQSQGCIYMQKKCNTKIQRIVSSSHTRVESSRDQTHNGRAKGTERRKTLISTWKNRFLECN